MTGLSAGARALVAGRLAVGVSSWVAPNLVARMFKVDPADNPQAPYVMRLFAVRDIALAAGVLMSDGEARRTWLMLGAACDAGDAAAALAGGRGGYLHPLTAVLGGAVAAGAVVMGAKVLGEQGTTA